MAKILIVEDDPFLRGVYEKALLKEGFEIELADSGEIALQKAEDNPPDLIVLDMLMAGIDGIEFLRRYDVKTKHPDVKVIVFSNMTLQDKVNEAIELGATNYKTKALFTPKEMVNLIRQTLTK